MKTRMTVSLQDAFPEIAAQWHPTKNGNLTPDMIAAGSNKKVAWLLPYDDPTTGKHFDFEWCATIYSRTSGMSICPFLSGKAVWAGFNDLATKRPDIAVYWNWEKNGDNKPTNFTEDSHVSVWWKYPYRDPKTGREFVFEWQDKIVNRVNAVEFCPFIKNNARVYPGFNDLLTTHPIIAGQWHPTKNGSLKPEMVTAGSSKTVVWLLPYDDPNTGNHFDFEWSARIADRTINGYGCPFLSGKQAWRGYNDLKTLFPDIAAQWHPCKNGNLRPDSVTPYSVKRVWWFLPFDDPVSGNHFDFEWKTDIESRTYYGSDCPYIKGKAVWPGYNDLETRAPEIAAQWHPSKNGNISPSQVLYSSKKKAWWLFSYDDPNSGKHFDFEWEARIYSRTVMGTQCPYLAGIAVWPGFNDLRTRFPDIAAQWHPTKNGIITPEKISYGSSQTVWWLLVYDDSVTGKTFNFEWEAPVKARTLLGNGCPYISNYALYPGFNDLQTRYPEIAAQWHPTKNGSLTPDKVIAGGVDYVWWLFRYDDPLTGKHFDFEWEAKVINRTSLGTQCPFIHGKAVWTGFNDLQTCYPQIAAEWHKERNHSFTPSKTYKFSQNKRWWKCALCGHEWFASVSSRTIMERGCPKCRKMIFKQKQAEI